MSGFDYRSMRRLAATDESCEKPAVFAIELTEQAGSVGTQPERRTGITRANWTMIKIADSLEVLERNGGDDGTRTRDLCRDRAAF